MYHRSPLGPPLDRSLEGVPQMRKSSVTYQQLIDYAAGDLPPPEAARVREHVRRDPEAAATVASFRAVRRSVAEDDSVAPSADAVTRARAIFRPEPAAANTLEWLEGVARTVARRIFDSRLQPVAVRYADTGRRIQLAYETDDLEVDLEAERLAAAAGAAEARWRLMGQINPAPESPDIAVAVVVSGTASPVAQTRTDDRAWFSLEVPAGAYDVCLGLPQGPLLLPKLELE